MVGSFTRVFAVSDPGLTILTIQQKPASAVATIARFSSPLAGSSPFSRLT